MMKDDNLIESLNGEKQIFIKDQLDKSVGIVVDGFGYVLLQIILKLKLQIFDE